MWEHAAPGECVAIAGSVSLNTTLLMSINLCPVGQMPVNTVGKKDGPDLYRSQS